MNKIKAFYKQYYPLVWAVVGVIFVLLLSHFGGQFVDRIEIPLGRDEGLIIILEGFYFDEPVANNYCVDGIELNPEIDIWDNSHLKVGVVGSGVSYRFDTETDTITQSSNLQRFLDMEEVFDFEEGMVAEIRSESGTGWLFLNCGDKIYISVGKG